MVWIFTIADTATGCSANKWTLLYFLQTWGEVVFVNAVDSEDVSEFGNFPPKSVVNSVKDKPRVSGMTKNTNKTPIKRTTAWSMKRWDNPTEWSIQGYIFSTRATMMYRMARAKEQPTFRALKQKIFKLGNKLKAFEFEEKSFGNWSDQIFDWNCQ